MYTVGSLCTGVAMIDLAFKLAGFDVRYQVEKNPFCLNVLRTRKPQFFPRAAAVHQGQTRVR